MTVAEEGIGTFISNTIQNNHNNLVVTKGGEPTFRKNKILSAMTNGALLGEGSRAVVEKNLFVGSRGHNVLLVDKDSENLIRHNDVRQAGGFGVLSDKGSCGMVCDNYFSLNGEGGCGTRNGGNATFIKNHSFEDKGPGIFIKSAGLGMFDSNRVEKCGSSGVMLEADANPTITGSVVSGSFKNGMWCCSGAKGSVSKCEFYANLLSGIAFDGRCGTKVRDVTTHDNGEQGASVGDGGSCDMEDVTMSHQHIGLRLSSSGSGTISKCTFQDNDIGVQAVHGGNTTVQHCRFLANSVAQVEFSDTGNAVVLECELVGGAVGLHATQRGRGALRDCNVTGCTRAAVVVAEHGCPSVEHCKMQGCKRGVIVEGLGEGTITRCHIERNEEENILVERYGATTFERNSIGHSIGGAGIVANGAGKFIANRIHSNKSDGVVVGSAARPNISRLYNHKQRRQRGVVP